MLFSHIYKFNASSLGYAWVCLLEFGNGFMLSNLVGRYAGYSRILGYRGRYDGGRWDITYAALMGGLGLGIPRGRIW